MAQQGTATAGQDSAGAGETGAGWEGLAGAPGSRAGVSNADSGYSAFGEGQSEAEAQLYAYLGHVRNSRPKAGFPPLEELNARLNEQPYRDSLLFSRLEGEEASEMTAPLHGEPYGNGLAWFDRRFDEMKLLLTRRDEGKSELAQINARLGEIMARVDNLSAGMPNGKAMASVETKLAALSRSLDETRQQSTADANRVARAAKEILAATARAQEAPIRFEMAARHTLEGLNQTITATASRAAVLAAGQVNALRNPQSEFSAADRLEAELRALNQQSRESGERTAAALDRVHNTLRDFLERGQAVPSNSPVSPHKKRAGLHEPISGNSAVYTRGERGFGAAPPSEARLDTLLLRSPPPSDPNFFEAIREANEKYVKKKAAEAENPAAVEAPAQQAVPAAFREEEKSIPLGGIGAVAFILLLVSAALLWLHSSNHVRPSHLSAAPAAVKQVRSPAVPQPAAAMALRVRGTEAGPALFAAAAANREASGQPASGASAEDLDMLENAARRGDRDAQFRIGTHFLNDGLDGGAATAARWFAKAAEQGHIEAEFMLASLYERGAGVTKDEAKALALYRKAAAAGHVRAMHNLGVLLSAHGTPQDYREAASWFERAAMAGLADSQYNLALLYERGLGLDQDLSRAYFWYRVAAKTGDKEATRQAERLKRTLPSTETATAGEQAGSWKPVLENTAKSADRGSGAKG